MDIQDYLSANSSLKCYDKCYVQRPALICGSVAFNHWMPSHARLTNDIDYIGYYKDFDFNKFGGKDSFTTEDNFIYTNIKLKVEFIDVTNCPVLEALFLSNNDPNYLDPKNCLILKNAHKHFYLGKYKKSFKHLMDYSLMLDLDIFFIYEPDFIISAQYRDWLIKNVYNNDERLTTFPNLNKTKDEFFTDGVNYYVDHDFIHEVVALKDKPAYTQCLNGEVKFSNKKFSRLDFEIKKNMVLEEAFVLVFERCLIPQFYGETYLPAFTPHEAFKYSLVRIATNITSGVFRSFAADHFISVYRKYEENHKDYYKLISKIIGKQ